jgi:hypothetical protein
LPSAGEPLRGTVGVTLSGPELLDLHLVGLGTLLLNKLWFAAGQIYFV